MHPRKQIREYLHGLINGMNTPRRIDKGTLTRYHDTDLPAVNVTTYTETVPEDTWLHGGDYIYEKEQQVQIVIYAPATDDFESNIDDIEAEMWPLIMAFDMPGVDLRFEGSSMSTVEKAVTPQGARILTFTARYEIKREDPNTIYD